MRSCLCSLSSAQLLLLAVLVHQSCCGAAVKVDGLVDVYSSAEAAAAISNPMVHQIRQHPSDAPGAWNMTEKDWPLHGYTLERTLILEGVDSSDGSLHYVDANGLMERVLVGSNGLLINRNTMVDDCFTNDAPYTCVFHLLMNAVQNGSIVLQDMVSGDATCVDIHKSRGGRFLFWVSKFSCREEGGLRYSFSPDNRSLWIGDSGWNRMPNGGSFRMINYTMRCTGNETMEHRVPSEEVLDELYLKRRRLPDGTYTVAGLALLSILLLQFIRAVPPSDTASSKDNPVEFEAALSRGWLLTRLLGEGHFGRVYAAFPRDAAKDITQMAALKVMDLSPKLRTQLVQTWKECQVMASVNHPNCVRVLKFYSTLVTAGARRRKATRLTESGYQITSWDGTSAHDTADFLSLVQQEAKEEQRRQQYTEVHDGEPQEQATAWGLNSGNEVNEPLLGRVERARQEQEQQQQQRQRQDGAGQGIVAWWRHALPGMKVPGIGALWDRKASYLASLPATPPGSIALQVHLVVQYCDRGTLLSAIKAGIFWDDHSGLPRLRDVAMTALEICQGLAYLHAPPRRLVHRDLSAANVLLSTADNQRGFIALVSDFGLATALAAETPQQYSEMKGTLQYMPPEVFTHDTISPAVDIYSLGILLYVMCVSHGPFDGQTIAQMVLSKMNSGDGDGLEVDREKLRLPWACTGPLQQLLWDCTQHNWRARPAAEQCVLRLQDMLRTKVLPPSFDEADVPAPTVRVPVVQPVVRVADFLTGVK